MVPPSPPSGAPLRHLHDLPGPGGLPFLGVLPALDRRQPHRSLEAWARQYGKVYHAVLGGRHLLVLSEPNLLTEVLCRRPQAWVRPPRLAEAAREFGFDGVFIAEGDAWRLQRPMVQRALDPSHLRAFFPTLLAVASRLERTWAAAAEDARGLDLLEELMRFSLEAVASLALGLPADRLAELEPVLEHVMVVMPAIVARHSAAVPWWRWLRLPSERAMQPHLQSLHRIAARQIEFARRQLAACPSLRDDPANLLQALVCERDRGDGRLTDVHVSGNVLTLLLAGVETSAAGIAWAIAMLHAHPDAARRARDEVRAVDAAQGLGSLQSLDRLVWLDACLKEALRLNPPVPVLMHRALEDTVVGDIQVPRGTVVVGLHRMAGRLSDRVERPEDYLPERWLDGQAGPGSTARHSLPFGAGPRLCPGRQLALIEMKLVTALWLARFDTLALETPPGEAAGERLHGTLWPAPLRMTLRRHRPDAAGDAPLRPASSTPA